MLHAVIALIVFLFPLAYSPGPGNMFFAANGARFGFRATIPATMGYHIATWVVTVAIGFGFIAALDGFPNVFFALKIAGALYLLWIAWKLCRADVLKAGGAARPASFADGGVLLLLNPKAYMIIALMFAQFLDHPAFATRFGVVQIATIFTLNNLVAFSVWTLIGDRIAGCFRAPESTGKPNLPNLSLAAILAGLGVWMLLS